MTYDVGLVLPARPLIKYFVERQGRPYNPRRAYRPDAFFLVPGVKHEN
nr:MAG TPA: hypothetical protein [Bacteriophage sp.]